MGNYKLWNYSYAADGKLDTILLYNQFNTLQNYTAVTSMGTIDKLNAYTMEYNADMSVADAQPTNGVVTFTLDGKTQSGIYSYDFVYDGKNRLSQVGQNTSYVGDVEYTLDITYNDQDNVTMLQYSRSDGATLLPITVSAYDSHPSPYSGIINYKFLMHNYAWDNYDPAPVLAALSKNNPLDYTFNNGATAWVRSMSYVYNEQGLPTQCTSVTTVDGGNPSTIIQTWAYECK